MNEGEDKEGGKFYLPFFESYRNAGRRLRSKELRCDFYEMIFDFWFDGKEPDFESMEDTKAESLGMAWELIVPVIEKSVYHKENSAKGGRNGKGVSRNKGNKHHAKKEKINSESIVNRSESIVNQYGEGEGNGNGNGEGNGNGKETESVNSGSLSLTSSPRKEKKHSKDHSRARAFWEEIRKVYPSHRRHAPAEKTLRFIEENRLWEHTEEIKASVSRFIAEDSQWKQGFIQRMANFIEGELWKNNPAPAVREVREIQKIFTSKPLESEIVNIHDVPRVDEETTYAPHVHMMETEHSALVKKYGNSAVAEMVEILDAHKQATGKTYASDAGAIRSWVVDKYFEKHPEEKPAETAWNTFEEIQKRRGEAISRDLEETKRSHPEAQIL